MTSGTGYRRLLRLIAGFLIAGVLLMAAEVVHWRYARRATEFANLVTRAHEVQAELNRLLLLLESIEAGSHSFVLTGDPDFLEPFTAGIAAADAQQARLAELIQDASVRTHLERLRPLIAERIEIAQRTVRVRQTEGFAAAESVVRTRAGKLVMDRIRSVFATMDEAKRALLTRREAVAEREARLTTIITTTATFASIAILLGLFTLVLRENRFRHRTELQLRNRELELRKAVRTHQLFVDHSLDILCTIDEQGRFVSVSTAAKTVWGYKPEEMIGRPYLDWVAPEDHPRTNEAAAAIMQGRAQRDFENRYRHRDGTLVPVMWSAVWSPEEKMMFCVARDVTERKISEERIHLLNQQLQRRAAELESANRELEAFSYTVSHDLRAPLRHINGFVHKLQRHLGDEKLDDSGKRLLATIAGSARTMGVLIDDLLAFARISRGEMRWVNVNLGQLVDECRRHLAAETAGRSIRWEVASLPEVPGDPALLRQVFVNLLGNAVKYTGRCPTAVIEIGTNGATGNDVVVFVRDNGAGFDMQYAAKLFGVFQRLHAQNEFEGTGIGLATARRIVERHGGRIWAEGDPGRGATFWISLPTRQLHADKHPHEHPSLPDPLRRGQPA